MLDDDDHGGQIEPRGSLHPTDSDELCASNPSDDDGCMQVMVGEVIVAGYDDDM